MREKIIEAMYEGWCDGKCESQKYDPDYESVFNLIREHTDVKRDARIKIENAICGLVCDAERNAFMNGVYVCLELMNGKLLKEV